MKKNLKEKVISIVRCVLSIYAVVMFYSYLKRIILPSFNGMTINFLTLSVFCSVIFVLWVGLTHIIIKIIHDINFVFGISKNISKKQDKVVSRKKKR